MCKIEVLVSTMNQTDYSLVEKMNVLTDAVFVNQCSKDDRTEFAYNGHRIIWINSSTKGLSVSRNICLENATADICLLADDDLEYTDDYVQIVSSAFEDNKNMDIIRFKVQGIEKKFKDYPQKSEKIGFFKSLKISSVELAFKRKKIEGIKFDELIGAGTNFCMGEENAWLAHCIRAKLKMLFLPITISNLHIVGSSWKNISLERYLLSRGAAFEAMETRFVHALIFQFAIRKRKRFRESLSLIDTVKLMEKGRLEYLTSKRKSEAKNA